MYNPKPTFKTKIVTLCFKAIHPQQSKKYQCHVTNWIRPLQHAESQNSRQNVRVISGDISV